MKKRFDFTRKNKQTGKIENVGYAQMEQTDDRATIYLYGDIVSATWQSMWYEEDKCPQDIADFINQVDSEKEIDIYFNSGGGDVFAGIAICNILKRHVGKIIGHVDGIAASIASVILCACDEIYRNTGSQVMVHKPWTYTMGNANDLREDIVSLDKCEDSMLEIYMTKAKEGVTREDIQSLLEQETWLSDDVFDYFNFQSSNTTSAAACASDYFDKYTNVPTALKEANSNININDIVNAVIEKMSKQNDDVVIAQEKEKKATALLTTLSLYGG